MLCPGTSMCYVLVPVCVMSWYQYVLCLVPLYVLCQVETWLDESMYIQAIDVHEMVDPLITHSGLKIVRSRHLNRVFWHMALCWDQNRWVFWLVLLSWHDIKDVMMCNKYNCTSFDKHLFRAQGEVEQEAGLVCKGLNHK